jgi:hypothetical protein
MHNLNLPVYIVQGIGKQVIQRWTINKQDMLQNWGELLRKRIQTNFFKDG